MVADSARRRAFTLMEMLAALAVVGALAAVAVIALSDFTARAQLAAAAANLRAVTSAVQVQVAADHSGELTRSTVESVLVQQVGVEVHPGQSAAPVWDLLGVDEMAVDAQDVAVAFDRHDLLVDEDHGDRAVLMTATGSGQQVAMLLDAATGSACQLAVPGPTTAGQLLSRTLACSHPAPASGGNAEDTQPPTAPEGVTLGLDGGGVELVWAPASDNVAVVGYEVHRSSDPDFDPSPQTLVAASLEPPFVDTDVAAGQWVYVVVAVDAAGHRTPSAPTSVTVPPGAAGTPTEPTSPPPGGTPAEEESPAPVDAPTVTGSLSEAGVSAVTWEPVIDAVSYDAQYRLSGAEQWVSVAPTGTSASVTLPAGSVVTWRVKASSPWTTSPWSAELTHSRVTEPPGGVVVVAGTTAGVSWGAVPGATGYVYQYRVNGGTWVAKTTTGTSGSTIMALGDQVEFRVAATSAAGTSTWSQVAVANRPPAQPTLSVSVSTAGVATATWPETTGAASYAVRAKVNGGSWSTPTVSGLSAARTITSGQTVTFQVAAVAAGGTTWSAEVSKTYLAAPTGLRVDRILVRSVGVTWNAVPGASSYTLRIGGRQVTTSTPAAALTLADGESSQATVTASGSGVTSAASAPLPVAVAPSSTGPMTFTRASSDTYLSMDNRVGTSLISPSGRYVAIFEASGRFAVYDSMAFSTPKAYTVSGTSLTLQSDGNLVLYTSAAPKHTQTYGYGTTHLVLQDDGNLVVYSAGMTPRWALSWGTGNVGNGASFMAKWG